MDGSEGLGGVTPGAEAPRRVFEDDQLRITRLGADDTAKMFLCFTGIGHQMGRMQADEFVGSTGLPGYGALFVSDKTRSWYNDFEPGVLVDRLRPLVDGRDLVTIGNSMGAFGAIWITRHLAVRAVIAFVPQWSVDPALVPEETRWSRYTGRIAQWRIPSLADAFVAGPRYFTFNDRRDRIHWSRFPLAENCHHYAINQAGHDIAGALKQNGVLRETVATCADGREPIRLIRDAGVNIARIQAARPIHA